MGKALKNLKKSIKECYEEEFVHEEPEEVIEDNSAEEVYEEKIENASFKIKCSLINYSMESGLPLCEYLDIENVKNYVRWLLEKQ